ncbi:MAG: hypothetical protein F4Y45_08810 [Acidobacteria bacterium]|nr:hypothetical protein [Acidobacteriota bacterium]MYJ03721.1 hypothetical protein [Acidobacteriota bacterium]
MSGDVLSRRISECTGVALFGLALFWLIAIATYEAADPVWFFKTGGQTQATNLGGQVGAFLAEVSHQVFGFAAVLVPVTLGALGWHAFWCRPISAGYMRLAGVGLLFICTAAFLSLSLGSPETTGRSFDAGGILGGLIATGMADYFNHAGSLVVVLTLLCLSIILSTQASLGHGFTHGGRFAARTARSISGRIHRWRTERAKARQRRDVVNKHLAKTGASTARMEILARSETGAEARRERASEEVDDPPVAEAPPVSGEPAGAITLSPPPKIKASKKRAPVAEPRLPLETERPVGLRGGDFTNPPITLLDAPKRAQKVDERRLMEGARLLEQKCGEFAVDGAVSQIQPGPVVTTFEFSPNPGVKYSKVTGLADDLCLAMEAESVLIERIPGKNTVGIQIPNPVRDQISLREMLESEPYQRSTSKLTLVLGKTIHGEPVVSDLATMPHLLIAGATGTGKSVSLNAMLTSILYRATPDDVRLILIDPKRLELGMYAAIPHLLTPVVVEPKQANNALRWAVREMEERYKQLAAEGVRNIDQYNRNVRLLRAEAEEKNPAGPKPGEEEEEDGLPRPLPYLVLAIDELADLMMVASKDVEESIARLAQMARAVGIHLILATQRPSVDVITGLIKANFPSRIAFRVSSKIDSRTILDANGAEQLLGKGDMLFLAPATSRSVRLHGPYISERETARFCSFLRKQGGPGYDESITEDEAAPDAVPIERDDLFDQAARIVVSSGQASISYLQRRLRIGFSRAARLVDMMEADGLVSAGTAGKPREVLVKPDYFEEIDAHLR